MNKRNKTNCYFCIGIKHSSSHTLVQHQPSYVAAPHAHQSPHFFCIVITMTNLIKLHNVTMNFQPYHMLHKQPMGSFFLYNQYAMRSRLYIY